MTAERASSMDDVVVYTQSCVAPQWGMQDHPYCSFVHFLGSLHALKLPSAHTKGTS